MIEMQPQFKPQEVERRLYDWWVGQGVFTPKIDPAKKPFVITLPPPNITGDLHMGHVSFLTIADIFGRYHRMRGDPTLLLPGTDHAAIAAQVTVEKQLAKENLTRADLGREKFLERMWAFINLYKPRIAEQIKAVGTSADWSRERFTMDEGMTEAVKKFFTDLQKDGLVYQGDYITTWCPRCQTVLSDLENIHREETGHLYFINYGPLSVATTRPETMLGDTAVAVHPEDERYQKLVGTKVKLPLVGREIPIIADDKIDPKFGTGAVKVTPAHSEADYELAQRHKLPAITVIDKLGKINENGGPYTGLRINSARAKIVEDLASQGLLEKTKVHTSSIGHCERCDTTTETLITKQWFVRMKQLAEPALQAVRAGKIKVVPESQTKVLTRWLEEIRDWAISRQLWWGHPLPVAGSSDTLDTWFSSALWPFATLGWPKETPDLKYFFPTSIMVTGRDIIFFWVARMIMTSLYEMKEVPFHVVYLNPFVLDEKGQKMSKTKGNVLDPIPLIAEYGADALRMALTIQAPANANVGVGIAKIKGMRNFANKIWNSARFVLAYEGPADTSSNESDLRMLARVGQIEKEVSYAIEKYRPNSAAEILYEFYWHEFCDVYLEGAKSRRGEAQGALLEVLARSLTLLHPFMPYVTEEIWQKLPGRAGSPLASAPWPTTAKSS
jgi:valyl-tRNA synthetase